MIIQNKIFDFPKEKCNEESSKIYISGSSTELNGYCYVQEEESSFYDANNGFKYRVTLESQVHLNKIYTIGLHNSKDFSEENNHFHAGDVVQMASVLVRTWKEQYGVYLLDKIQSALSNIHVLVVKNKKEIDRLLKDKTKDKKINAAMLLPNNAFLELPRDAKFGFIILAEAFKKNNPRTSIHEMVHMISYIENGYTDKEHLEERFWPRRKKIDCLVSLTVQNYKRFNNKRIN